MATVRLRHGAQETVAELTAERSWSTLASGSIGQASITLPIGAPAASPRYVDPDGGSWVTIAGESNSGDWSGVITGIDYDGRSAVLRAVQPAALFTRRLVSRNGTRFTHVSPGLIVSRALTEGLAGVRGFRVSGTFDTGAPDIAAYAFEGQSVWQVVTDMMDRSDQELSVDEDGALRWSGMFAGAPRYTPLLVADGDLRAARYGTRIDEQLTEYIAYIGMDTYRASSGGLAARSGWAAQDTGQAGTGGQALVSLAAAQLAARGRPTVTAEGQVTRAHWGLRERMFCRLLVPTAGFSGRIVTARVVGRSLADSASEMRLQLQAIDMAATGGRPSTMGRDRGGSSQASVGSMLLGSRRRIASLERRLGGG